jgi:hypothetical protein
MRYNTYADCCRRSLSEAARILPSGVTFAVVEYILSFEPCKIDGETEASHAGASDDRKRVWIPLRYGQTFTSCYQDSGDNKRMARLRSDSVHLFP